MKRSQMEEAGGIARTTPPVNKSTAGKEQYLLQSIPSSRREAILEYLTGVPKSWRATYLNAVSGRSLRSAINGFCGSCVMWDRVEIAQCTDRTCPLFAVRPFRASEKAHGGRFSGPGPIPHAGTGPKAIPTEETHLVEQEGPSRPFSGRGLKG
jgi:hypothetical protein